MYQPETGPSKCFLVGDSGVGDDDLIVVSGRESANIWISRIDKIYVDATLSLTPKLFQQVFVVLVEFADVRIPISHACLPNKSQATYPECSGFCAKPGHAWVRTESSYGTGPGLRTSGRPKHQNLEFIR